MATLITQNLRIIGLPAEQLISSQFQAAVCLTQVSLEMMLLGELEAATLITQKMIQRGDVSDATYICKAMAEHGHGVRHSSFPF